ncbi:MAG: enolase C-terminal domain-like protein [Planctomycetota bacterium]
MSFDSPYPEPPAELTKPGLRPRLAFLGPGIILASVTIGSGELVWASRSGAIFGYGMLWCFLYAGLFKAIQVHTAARHFTLTGEHPMVGWRKLPGPPLWFPLLVAVPAVLLMPIAFSGKRRLLEAGGVDVLNVHGAIAASRAAAHLAGDFGIPVALGNTILEIGVHLAASLPECLYMEYSDLAWNRLAKEPVRFENGWAYAPDRPGHGIDLDRDALAEYSRPE